MAFAGVHVPVCQRSRCDVKRNLKMYTDVKCSEIVLPNVMSHVHVHVLHVAKPL